MRTTKRMTGDRIFSILKGEVKNIKLNYFKTETYLGFTIRIYNYCTLHSIFSPENEAIACRQSMQEAKDFIDEQLKGYRRVKIKSFVSPIRKKVTTVVTHGKVKIKVKKG